MRQPDPDPDRVAEFERVAIGLGQRECISFGRTVVVGLAGPIAHPKRDSVAEPKPGRVAEPELTSEPASVSEPAVPRPGKIVCVGLNYREHAAEGGRAAPTRPLLFAKFSNTVIGDGAAVVHPAGSHALDLEVELGVVIGMTASHVSVDDALSHVAGYVVVNDISARDWQGSPPALRDGEVGDGQWLRAKGSDTFLPMSARVVPAPDVPDPQALHLRSWRIPGPGQPDAGTAVPMQDANTSDMIWTVAELIAFISASITLEPGDIIATGTPSGVGVFRDPPVFLQVGDRVRCEIEGIGSIENPIVAEG